MTHLLEYQGEEAKFNAKAGLVSTQSVPAVPAGELLNMCAWHLPKYTNGFTKVLRSAGYEVSHGCCIGCKDKFLTNAP